MLKTFTADLLQVNIYENRSEMGKAAAADIADAIRRVLAEKEVCNMIFAAAPSQNEVLASIVADKSIDFTRINAFHMDEYIGLPGDAPQAFGNFLRRALFDHAPWRSVNYINGNAADIEAECARYTALLTEYPTDIVVLGIGENGHVAFNDPPVADFADPVLIKPVPLDPICRQQQVNDGCFASLDLVPTHALTLTVPALMAGKELYCVVPAPTKANAVASTVNGPVGEHCPATAMRNHPHASLYIEPDSAAKL